jgi:hypothetical protein
MSRAIFSLTLLIPFLILLLCPDLLRAGEVPSADQILNIQSQRVGAKECVCDTY